ncbi:hypothetical protein PF003_g32558 [Phytophthora fragariae]|nr:hypothetical protein PF003_g32558 [Phytophthora fragariae]
MEYCESRTDEVDCEVDTDEANAFLIGTMERRDRLDIVHDRLQLPRLDNGHYDMDILTRDLPTEAARLQAQAGNPGAGSPVGTDPLPSAGHRPVTSTAMISKHGRVSIQALQRILNTRAAEPEHMADRTKLRQLRKENHTALRDWMTRGQHRQQLNLPAGSTNTLLEVLTALIEHRVALHELLATLPYPELAVKVLPKAVLLRWGDLEAYDVQVSAIRHVLLEESASLQAKDYYNTWLHACTTDNGSLRDRTIARDPDRRRRLASLFPDAPAGARPTGIDPECWAILHTLQHAAWAWEVTPWGAAPRTILGSLYHDHPALQRVCESVAVWSDWGEVISLPSGFTWEDRMVSMETGLSAQAHY